MIAQRNAPAGDERAAAAPAGLQVRSLIAPISGWMSRPVIGPGEVEDRQLSGSAPISRKSGFTADWVRPKLNWTPKNPRFIIRMAPPLISGLRSWSSAASTLVLTVSPTAIPTSDCEHKHTGGGNGTRVTDVWHGGESALSLFVRFIRRSVPAAARAARRSGPRGG